MNKDLKDLQQYLEFLKKDAEQNIVFNNTSNTYMDYVNAVGENSINEYVNNTFSKNGMNMLQYLHDVQSLLTCDALGLLIWGNILQVSRQTQIPDYFKNVGLYELDEDPISNFDVESQTNDNLGDYIRIATDGGNYNNTYTQSQLTDEEFRKCLLLKYRGQWCCGTISNLSDILNWTFYWKDYQWRDGYKELPSDYVPPTPLDEIDYPIKFRVLNNQDYILIIESNRTIETPNELKSNLRYRFIFQYCNLFPQVGGNSYRFNWIGWEDPNYIPLPDINNVATVLPNPTIKQLSDAGLLIKYLYGSNMTTFQDIIPIPISDTSKVMSGTTGYTQLASKNIVEGGLPLIRQYENYMDSCTVNTAMSLATGNIPCWLVDIIYNKDAVIREYDTTGYWVYYQSLIDGNRNNKPTLASHVGWFVINSYKSTEDGTEFANIKAVTVSSIFEGKKYVNIVDGHGVTIFNELGQPIVYLASNGSICPHYEGGYFKDFNMSKVIGNITRYRSDTGQSYYKDRLLTLSNGAVISMVQDVFSSNAEITLGYANGVIFKDIPFVIFVPDDTILLNAWRLIETTTGHITFQPISDQPPELKFGFTILAIGTLASYVGDELAKIRAYKSSFYYDDLPEDKKLELRQYYISIDETKDLTKVTAPEWLEAELDGKELA